MNSIAPTNLIACLLLYSYASTLAQDASLVRSREEFATAMARIQKNMPESEVAAILGRPDDIRTHLDPGGISFSDAKEVWCYGAKGHLGFPTLGCVYIGDDGQTQEVLGGKGRPPKLGLFAEDELQSLLRLLDTSPGLAGHSFNPLPLIQIVNTLQSLGKDKALAAMAEYLRVSDRWPFPSDHNDNDGLYPVLLTLFDFPDNVDPRKAAGFGGPDPCRPDDPHLIPRFPIVIVDGIPLMLARGYLLAGVPSHMTDVFDFFRTNGVFRSQPLTPGNNPLAALNDLINSKQWIYDDDRREKAFLMEQLLRLIDSVYRLPANVIGDRLSYEDPEPAWEKALTDVSRLKIKWDPRQQTYEFTDGRHFPPLPRKIYQRAVWPLTGMGYDKGQLILERLSDDYVDVTVNLVETPGGKLKSGKLYFCPVATNEPPLLTFFSFTGGVAEAGGYSERRAIDLKDGAGVRAVLVIDGYLTNSSPIFKP